MYNVEWIRNIYAKENKTRMTNKIGLIKQSFANAVIRHLLHCTDSLCKMSGATAFLFFMNNCRKNIC